MPQKKVETGAVCVKTRTLTAQNAVMGLCGLRE